MTQDRSAITCKISVNWADCDPAGIVFYPHFYRWFDNCTHDLMNRQNVAARYVIEKYGILGCGLIDTGATFHAPARFGDDLEAVCRITEWSRRTFRVEHSISRTGLKICTGFEVRGWFIKDDSHPGGMRAGEIPQEFRAAFSPD